MASLLGLPLTEVPRSPDPKHAFSSYLRTLEDWLERRNLAAILIQLEGGKTLGLPSHADTYWIAIVRVPGADTKHAIVMRGWDLEWNPEAAASPLPSPLRDHIVGALIITPRWRAFEPAARDSR